MKVFCHISGDGDLLEAWLRHYSGLGGTSFHFIVHGTDDENRLLLGLGGYPTRIFHRYDGPMWEMVKIYWLNRAIAEARGEWVLVVDSDEFLELPHENLPATTAALEQWGLACMPAPLLQRVPAGGRADEIPPGPVEDPFSMMPLAVPDLCPRMGANPELSKFPLFFNRPEARIRPGSHRPPLPHQPDDSPIRGVTHHFKWRGSIVQRLQHSRLDMFHWPKMQYDSYTAYLLQNNGRFPVDGGFHCTTKELWERGFLRKPATGAVAEPRRPRIWHVAAPGGGTVPERIVSRIVSGQCAGNDARLLLLVSNPLPQDWLDGLRPVADRTTTLHIPACGPLDYEGELELTRLVHDALAGEGPDVIHVHGEHPAWAALLAAARWTATRLVLEISATPAAGWGWLLPVLKDLPDALVFPDRASAEANIDRWFLAPERIFIGDESRPLLGGGVLGGALPARPCEVQLRKAFALAAYHRARARQLKEHQTKWKALKGRFTRP